MISFVIIVVYVCICVTFEQFMTFERAAHLLTPLGDERASKLVHNADTAPFGMAAAIMMRTLSRAGALADDAKSVRQAWNSANVDLMALISDTAVRQQEEVRQTHARTRSLRFVDVPHTCIFKCIYSWQVRLVVANRNRSALCTHYCKQPTLFRWHRNCACAPALSNNLTLLPRRRRQLGWPICN